jgi:hypothetical protein
MKALTTVLLTLIVSNANAWTAIKCSNSDGSVFWETGTQVDEINLKYANFVEGTLTLPVEQVSIQLNKEIKIREKTIRDCTMTSTKRVFAGNVKIVAADKHPDVLRGQFPENKVETEVICTRITTTELPCEEGTR